MSAALVLVCVAAFGSTPTDPPHFYSNGNDYYEEGSGSTAPPGVIEALAACGKALDMTDCSTAAKKIEVGGHWIGSCVEPDHPDATMQIKEIIPN